jgi:hypothetical protein
MYAAKEETESTGFWEPHADTTELLEQLGGA